MGVRFEWDPNAVQKLEREVLRNAAPHFNRAVVSVRCPDHPEARFGVEAAGDHWQLTGVCCQKGKALAEQAISRATK